MMPLLRPALVLGSGTVAAARPPAQRAALRAGWTACERRKAQGRVELVGGADVGRSPGVVWRRSRRSCILGDRKTEAAARYVNGELHSRKQATNDKSFVLKDTYCSHSSTITYLKNPFEKSNQRKDKTPQEVPTRLVKLMKSKC